MPDDASTLYGRDSAVALVREFATRPEPDGYPTTRRTPVLIFTGPKGCGKTALLDDLERRMRDHVPHARINCADERDETAWKVLSRLAFDLNRTAAGYRSIPFPRFVTAQVAIAAQLDGPGPVAQARIRQAVESTRNVDRLRAFLSDLGQEVAGAVPVVGGVPGVAVLARYAPNLLLDGLVSWRRGRRVVLGEGLEWYGDHPYDELVQLNLDVQGDRKAATELLWSAFLADLRAAFARGRGARSWSLNPVVLLDDIDTKPGRLLYRALVDARRREPDPLTVVATSAGGVVRHVAPDGEVPFAEEAGYADYLERRQGEYESDSYPVALRDLTLDEVKDMVSDVAGPRLAGHRAVAARVYRFTRGHPAATAVVVKAVGDHGETSVKRLLDAPWRGPVDKDPVTVGERLLRELLGTPADASPATAEKRAAADASPGAAEKRAAALETRAKALEPCAAARDVEQAAELAGSGLVPVRGGAGLVPDALQVHDPDTGRMVLVPALRYLLLRRLAADPERWTAVHTWLRDHGRAADRDYHALALRDVDAVVRELVELLPDARAWLTALESVTAAPNDLDTDEADPDRVLAATVRPDQTAPDHPDRAPAATGHPTPAAEPARSIGRVLAALWIANDPLSDADRPELWSSAALDLRELAKQPGVARNEFLQAAKRWEARAEEGDTPVSSRGVRRQAAARPAEPVDFTPPTPARALRRARVRVAVLVAVLVLVVGSLVVVGVDLVSRCGEGVRERGGECVGVTDGSYVFHDSLADVQRRIVAENERVAGQPHVTVAMLTPLLPNDVGSVTWQRVRAQLEGAHAAQLAANEDKQEPKIRLLLANPGSTEQEWRRVVDQLVDLADEQRLVGVIGVGQSTVNARHAASALAEAGIPMVASVVTATGFQVEPGEPPRYLKGFARVSSTTGTQIAVLAEYLAGQGLGRAMLVYDVNEDDLYTSTLYREFKDASARGTLSITVENRFDTEATLGNQFKQITRDLCGDGAPSTVLYAGRAVLLDDLIDNLKNRSCARDRLVTLVTGSDASMLRTRPELQPRPDQAPLAVVYTPHVDPQAAREMGITEFAALTARFERLGFDPTDLADGWGVMMHDAMLAIWDVISRASVGLKPGDLPTRLDVRAELARSDRDRNQVRGAGGPFTLDATTGNAVGRRLPVIELGPTGTFAVKAVFPAR
ncbi:hypothetical protein [Saccharothrix variisporea]|uniref:ABC-type branched-subunit amino acid transport system substrate-binding protein n=1 Tax=Saccharothrix variisporea TaxID=543527 RepID=A0A495XKD3_9PSEU|nr:hypothetical protein [Saccharothrix variisporea]RKT75031.1 hypothetical protein DFJ66_8407 [Saccharothrix variisporea]